MLLGVFGGAGGAGDTDAGGVEGGLGVVVAGVGLGWGLGEAVAGGLTGCCGVACATRPSTEALGGSAGVVVANGVVLTAL